jgi:hypothetical protein
MQTFSCDELAGTDTSYLRADYALECYTDTHTYYMVRHRVCLQCPAHVLRSMRLRRPFTSTHKT